MIEEFGCIEAVYRAEECCIRLAEHLISCIACGVARAIYGCDLRSMGVAHVAETDSGEEVCALELATGVRFLEPGSLGLDSRKEMRALELENGVRFLKGVPDLLWSPFSALWVASSGVVGREGVDSTRTSSTSSSTPLDVALGVRGIGEMPLADAACESVGVTAASLV
jgi:hypothetical protein